MEFVLLTNPAQGNDSNNCTIVSLSAAANIPYSDVDKIGIEAGRKKHRGFYVSLLAKKAREKGIYIKRIPIKTKMNISQFISKYPKGRFVVTRRGHAFCAIDGKIYDIIPNGEKCIVNSIYKVKSNRLKYIQDAVKKIN